MANPLLLKALKYRDKVIEFRRDFHQFPELGFNEFRSSAIIAAELDQLGYKVKAHIANTGVTACLGSGKPVVMLRFDMDALPIIEQNKVSYSSKNPGFMHACGHDGHMAVGLVTARLLADEIMNHPGTIKVIFQPAEEGLGGAEKMIESSALEDPAPDYCLGMHIWNDKPLGWVGITPGPIMAGSDIFHVKLHGVGGHGAIPQQSKDVVVAASMLVQALQSIVSRNVAPLESAVVSVTMIKAGDAFNVIPEEAELKGTIRYFKESIHMLILKRFYEIVNNVASALGCKAEIKISDITPVLNNESTITSRVFNSINESGIFEKFDDRYQTMGSEDMAFFQQKIPGCYIFFGSANYAKGFIYGHHHPKFDFDEDVLPKCAAAITVCAIDLLDNPPKVL